MKLIVKHFTELSLEELVDIYKLRVSVFIVEQECPYQDIDDTDKISYHLWLEDEDGMEAYARVVPPGEIFAETSVGRVIARKRRCGLGTQIVAEAVRTAQEKFQASTIKIEAQLYARSLYEKAGFVQVSDTFLEDGIPHILMELKL